MSATENKKAIATKKIAVTGRKKHSQYTTDFRRTKVREVLASEGKTISEVATESGLTPALLWLWCKKGLSQRAFGTIIARSNVLRAKRISASRAKAKAERKAAAAPGATKHSVTVKLNRDGSVHSFVASGSVDVSFHTV